MQTASPYAEKKKFFFVAAVLLIGILLRLVPLNSVLYTDDIVVMNVAEQKYFLAPANINPHPPLGNLMLILSTTLFGITPWSFRLPAFLFSIATIILVYVFTKHFFNEKAALWSLLFISLFGWHIYSAATNIGGDGILASFLLLASYYFLQYIHQESSKKHLLIGILIALASFVKETTIILAPVLFLYIVLTGMCKKQQIKETCKQIALIILGFILPWLLFASLDFFFNQGEAMQNLINLMLRTGVEKSGYIAPGIFHYLFSFFKLAVWITPFFLLITMLWYFQRRKKENEIPSAQHINASLYIKLFLLVFGAFFLVYISPSFDKPRYLLVIVPFLCIIAGEYLSRFTFTKKELLSLLVTTLVCFTLFFVMNQQRNSISFDQPEKIMENIKTLQLNFDTGLISETGNSGFVVKFNVVLLGYLAASLFVLAYLFTAKHKQRYFIIFFGVAFAFNLFVAQEYVFHLTAPNYSEVSKELHTYALTHELKQPIYLFKDPSIAYYLKTKYTEFKNFDVIQNSPEKIQQFKDIVREEGGTIILVDLPFVNKEGELWQVITTNCAEEVTIVDKGVKAGHIFTCNGNTSAS